jgi:tRNA1(Val) A37 N6-methylase TrmN6
MNHSKVHLPIGNLEIEQLTGGHPVTDAAAYLQECIIKDTRAEVVSGLELGSGNGIITLMLALQKPAWTLAGIEIQRKLVDLAEQNALHLTAQVQFIWGDICEYKDLFPYRKYSLVYSNPPWTKSGSGIISPDPARAISRQEVACTMKDILACLDWCLSPAGTGWLIYPTERKNELAREVRLTSLEVSNLFEPEENSRYFVAKLRTKVTENKWF